MPARRLSSGMLLILMLAVIGILLLTIPPKLVEQYRIVAEQHPTWARVYLITVGLGGLCLIIATFWTLALLWRRSDHKRRRKEQRRRNPSQLTASQQQRELEQNLASIESFQGDGAVAADVRRELADLHARIDEKQTSQRLEIVAFGAISSGKSSLLNLLAGRDVFRTDARGGTTVQRNELPWPGTDRVVLVDTPGLGEIDGAEHVRISTESAKDADLVLLVVDGPLRDFEFDLLRRLREMEKRVLLCINKVDWYDATQQARLRQQLVEQVKGAVDEPDVLSVAAQPVKRRRVRVRSDGTELEEEAVVPADISALADRLMRVIAADGRDLLLANLLLQSRGLVTEARQRVQDALDRRAWELIDTYMWAAGGAAAVSPLPLIDLAAGSAVSIKMVLALAKVYRQTIDLDGAARLLAQLGKNLVAILGMSLATPAVATAIGSLLKMVPGAGTIAGGLLQGLTQAIITRWIGAVFMQYFKQGMHGDDQAIADMARKEWDHVTSVSELRKVVQAARNRLVEPDRSNVSSPDVSSPDVSSPNVSSPDASTPNAGNP